MSATTGPRPGSTREFTRVDQTEDVAWFVSFMDVANALPDYGRIREVLRSALGPLEGCRVLDVGTGTGDDARELARHVGPSGCVVGADLSEVMIGEATARSAATGPLPVTFEVADMHQLPFEDGRFDAVRVKLALSHCSDLGRAIDELIRVTRPGGRIAAFEYDFETLVVDHPDRRTTRQVVDAWVRGHQNGWIGRQLAGQLGARGLDGITVTGQAVLLPFTFFHLAVHGNVARYLSSDVLDHWWEPLHEAEAKGLFFAAQTGFLVAGTRG